MNDYKKAVPLASARSPSARLRRRRWWLLASAVLLLVLLVLRETGFLSLRLASLQTRHRFVTTGTSQRGGAEKGEFEDLTLKAELSVNPHPAVAAAAGEQLRSKVFGQGPTNGVVRIAFKEGGLTGPYWLPLFKQGHCRSRAECEWTTGQGRNAATKKISVQTDVDARAIGLMSVREFKVQFSDAIAERIAQVLRDKLEKK